MSNISNISDIIDIIKISFLEYRKFLLKTSTYIFVGIAFVIAFLSINMSLVFYRNPNKAINATEISQIFNFCMQFVIIFQAAAMLTEEFKRGTIPFLFTSSKSRTQILFSKILSFLIFSLTICLLGFVLLFYYSLSRNIKIESGFFVLNLVLYLSFAWFIGNYFMFFSVVIKSRTTSLVTGMFFLFLISDFISELINKFPVLNKFLRFMPFDYIFKLWIREFDITKIISLLISGIIFFILSAFIIEKQDLV